MTTNILAHKTKWEQCPVCDSTQIEGDSISIEGRFAYQEVVCLDCGAAWGEEYSANMRYDIRDRREE